MYDIVCDRYSYRLTAVPCVCSSFIIIICDLLRENRPSGVVCQNLVTYRVGCTSNGRSHRENLRTIARSVVELF